jgi:hypothetical protein
VVVSNHTATVSFSFLAPDAETATNLTQELDEYFHTTMGMHLIPPWSPEAQQPDFEKRRQARRDWLHISSQLNAVEADPALETYDQRINAAARRGARTESKRLSEERQDRVKELTALAVENLRTNPTNRLDPELVALQLELSGLEFTNRIQRSAVLLKAAAKLGLERHAEENHPGTYCVTFGSTSRKGLLIQLHWTTFRDAFGGARAFAGWLCDKGCTNIRYEFLGGGSYLGDMLEEGETEN